MAVSRNLDILDLPSILQNLADSSRTGTLKVTSGGKERFIRFENGTIRMVCMPEDQGFLADALVRVKAVQPSALTRLKQAMRDGDALCESALASGMVNEKDLERAYQYYIMETICVIVAMSDVSCEFIPGDLPKEFLTSKDLQRPASVHPGGILLEAARRIDVTALIRKTIPSRRDVPMKNREVPDAEGDKAEVLKLVNGIRDVDDIVAEARMGKFEAEYTVKELIDEGILRLKEWSELVSTAKFVKEHGGGIAGTDEKISKITRLYERAEELGFTSPQVRLWLARAYERCGRNDDACKRYLELGRELLDQKRHEDAVALLRQAAKLAPWDLDIRRQLVKGLIAREEREQAAVVAGGLIMKLQAAGELQKALEFAREIEADIPKHEAILKPMAEINLEMGDRIQALIELEDLANLYVEQKKYPQAVETYQKILEIDRENIEAHFQLASTLKAMGDVDQASRRYKQLAEMLSSSALEDSINWDFLIKIYENIVSIEPQNVTARDWLANAYMTKGDKEKALVHLRGIRDTLAPKDPVPDELISALSRIVALVPSDLDARHELAAALGRAGQVERSVQAYLALADLALSRQEVEVAWSAFADALQVAPYHMGVHRGLADFHKRQGRNDAGAAKLRDLGYLKKAAGRLDEALAFFREAQQLDPASYVWMRELAETFRHADKNDQALKLFEEYARLSLAHRNVGEARAVLRYARQIDPHVAWTSEVEAQMGAGAVPAPK